MEAEQSRALSELAKQSTQTFMYVSMVQLLLMSFIAPVFCAGAITQEKDANTYHILLTTPLSNAQIVLGSLFSRICFVWVLLLSGLPIFCITMLYGGVTTTEICESFGRRAPWGRLARTGAARGDVRSTAVEAAGSAAGRWFVDGDCVGTDAVGEVADPYA